LHGAALERDAVCGDCLQDDGGADDGRDTVVADAAVAERVAVDLACGSVMRTFGLPDVVIDLVHFSRT